MRTAVISLEADTRLARWGVRLAAFLRPVIGDTLTMRLATVALRRGVRYRIDGGRWRTLRANATVTRTGCDHRDGYGSTVIVGEVEGAPPVCILCDQRFPESPNA